MRHIAAIRSTATTRATLSSSLAIVVLLALMAGGVIGCGGRLKGTIDYDRELDFQNVKTLAFYEDAYPIERKQTETRQLIRADIEQVLRDRGYGFGRTGEADLLIIYHVGTHAKMRLGSMTGTTAGEASLAIAFQDPVTRRSAWYGTVEQTWTDQLDVAERVSTAVRVLLDNFPPPKNGSSGEQTVRE